jgi:TPR repeat protein
MYESGEGVPQDYKEAHKWYRLAAAQGNADAQNNLGAMHENGEGVAQDYVRAHMWFDVAALSSQDERRKAAADNRDAITSKMTSAQIEQAQALARTCLQSNYKECD